MTEQTNRKLTKSVAFELSDDVPSNRSEAPTIGDVIGMRFGRRDLLKGSLGVTAAAAVMGVVGLPKIARAAEPSFDFDEISHGIDGTHHVATGYDADILIRWGDPVVAGAPPFDPHNQTPDAQAMQFGYNNDYLGYQPLPMGSDNARHGLLYANHEYTNEELMFPGLGRQDSAPEGEEPFGDMTRNLVDIEMAAHGGSIVEIMRGDDGKWSVVPDSQYGRRITTNGTEMLLTGPAAGSDRLKTSADPTGTRVIGMVNNCAGGITPWGTILTGEENFHGYFNGTLEEGHPETANHERYGVPDGWYAWGTYHDRWNVGEEPNEANRFGYIVEIDPYDPESTPLKRTALGRFKHEGANVIINGDGRVVAYMGDDQRFDYLYKFVSDGTYNPDDRAANMDLLDNGTLYVAQFHDDGTATWLPLVHGEGPLTAENGFNSQADVCISTRLAADLLGATPMDRPEDVEPNPVTNKVYVMLTNNSRREAEQVDGPNPRAENRFGQVLELSPPDGDHTSLTDNWELLVVCGDPSIAEVGAMWNPATSENGWFGSPDNLAIDHQGRLWISTDQGSAWARSGTADGVWAMETEGELRGTSKMFFRVPAGAECCGPVFTPDDETLFVAPQHVAADGMSDYPGFERPSTFDDPATRWPDFDPNMPPRPSVVAITKQGGGKIG